MPESLWSLVAIAVVAALCVRAAALVAPAVNLRILPVHRRFRVEWCTVHVRQVELVTAALVGVLLLGELVAAVA